MMAMMSTKNRSRLLFIVTICTVVSIAILNIHITSSSLERNKLRLAISIQPEQPEKVPTENFEDVKTKSCCNVRLNVNAGHTFTDVTLQLNRCGPIISISRGDKDTIPFYSQVLHLTEIFNKTTTTHDQCIEYYTHFPEQHPKRDHPFAFAMLAKRNNATYDAYEVGRNLRESQKILLSACGLKPPIFEHTIRTENSNFVDGRIFEKVERPPAKRVVILVRRPVRTLTNAHELLPICKDLRLRCKIIYMDEYWSQKETSDLCYVLKTFEDSIIIGMPGAEIIYPQILGLRHILLSQASKDRVSTVVDRRHYGTAQAKDGEFQLANNLVKPGKKWVLPSFFPEFELHFGAELMVVSGEWHDPAESSIPNKAETILETPQCHDARGEETKVEGIKDYCLDMDINVLETKLILEKYISEGNLFIESEIRMENAST